VTDPATEVAAPRRFRIANRRSEALTLVLEPWANEYPLPPGDEVEILEEGPISGDPLEVHFEATHVVVYARMGTFLRIFRDGLELR
jgi:hypothetical protein